jgi:hypothetical protein
MKLSLALTVVIVLCAAPVLQAQADSPQLAVKTGIWEFDQIKTVNGKATTIHNCLGIRASEFVAMKTPLNGEKQCAVQVTENTATVYAYKATCRPSGEASDLVGSGTISGRIVAESPTRVRVNYDGARTSFGMKLVEHEEELNEWRGSGSTKECKQPEMSVR